MGSRQDHAVAPEAMEYTAHIVGGGENSATELSELKLAVTA